MFEIGKYNKLPISRLTSFGAYLDGGAGTEILIPARFLPEIVEPEQEMDVFVFTDSEDRLIATTEKPFIQAEQFGFLQVKDVNPRVGAFLDWGLMAKDLLCPFNEQKVRMSAGNIYLVYAYVDHNTGRVVASSKIEKFLGNIFPEYRQHQRVEALVYERTEIGYKVIVDNQHAGMLYVDELIEHPEIGSTIQAFVKKVRDDGKIDITLKDTNGQRAHNVADRLVELMKKNGGLTGLTDKSTPEEIEAALGCSKKDFKKAVGFLYKSRRIELREDGMKLI